MYEHKDKIINVLSLRVAGIVTNSSRQPCASEGVKTSAIITKYPEFINIFMFCVCNGVLSVGLGLDWVQKNKLRLKSLQILDKFIIYEGR